MLLCICLADPNNDIYGTAQRQLDTRMRAAGWILSGEDYIMHSILEQVPTTFVAASGKLSDVWSLEPYIILHQLLNEYYKINSIYTMNLQILSLYAGSNRSLNPLCYWKTAARVKNISYPTVWPCVENEFSIENGFLIGNWISINLFEFVQSVGWKVRKYQYFSSEMFVDVWHSIICELNNRQHSSRKLLFLYQYPSEAWQYKLASCT